MFVWIFCKNHNFKTAYLYFYCAINTINHLYPVPAPLEDKNTLKQFHISDTLEWCNGTIDIAPEYILEHGEPVHSENDLPVAAEAPLDYEQ